MTKNLLPEANFYLNYFYMIKNEWFDAKNIIFIYLDSDKKCLTTLNIG